VYASERILKVGDKLARV